MPKKNTNNDEADNNEGTGKTSAADYLPETRDLPHLRQAAMNCQGCDLYKDATQTIFGEGDPHAPILMIGEQPGDQEDKEGHPFVGPAGKLFRRAMIDAGLDVSQCYITNAVKHFKYEWRGKRRIHSKPRRIEVVACLPWLTEEIKQVQPQIIVCLGATAAQALLGTKFRLTQHRGEFIESDLAPYLIATVHPSSILRAVDDETRDAELEMFVADLRLIAQTLEEAGRA